MTFKIVVLVLFLWWCSSMSTPTKKVAGDVGLGAGSVDFEPIDGEWNPFYVKKPSVDLEGVNDGAATTEEVNHRRMEELTAESAAAIRDFNETHPDQL
jgi:hypothetical protein